MACNSISGLTYDACASNIGGIKKIYLANWEEGAYTVGSGGVITAVTTASGNTWQKFEIRKNTASFTSTLNVGDEGGHFVSTVLSMVFSRMETQKRIAIESVIAGEALCLVQDCNGIWWALGKDNPVTVSAGTGETGVQKTDANHYTLEVTDESEGYPFQVSDDAIEALDLS